MTTETTTETLPAIAVEQDGNSYFIYAQESAFVEAVALSKPDDDKDEWLILFILKDGSEYAYFSTQFTLANIFGSLFTQPVLSLGKWMNSYVKPLGKVVKVKAHDPSLGTRVTDRLREEVTV